MVIKSYRVLKMNEIYIILIKGTANNQPETFSFGNNNMKKPPEFDEKINSIRKL